MHGPPIFILGMSWRVGTHYLRRLSCLHPYCAQPKGIGEDLFLVHADQLRTFVEKLTERPNWKSAPEAGPELLELLGSALVAFLERRTGGRRVVTSTASVRNIHFFFDFFPNARLLIIVRDGRAAVESMVSGFGTTYEEATSRWVNGARTLLAFMGQAHRHADKYDIVRYEDLYLNCEATMRRLLGFLDLPAERYDFAAARDLPVIGSSVFRGEGAPKVHWRPVPRTPDFRPLERWHQWDAPRLDAFRRAAGRQMTALGYPMEKTSAPGGR